MVGTDLVEISRMRLALERTPRFRQRVFSEREALYCEARANPYPSFAVRFAAKEAFRKLHPDLTHGTRFQEVEMVPGAGGHPRLVLSGRAKARAESLGIYNINISVSHAGNYALAVVEAPGLQGGMNGENCESSPDAGD